MSLDGFINACVCYAWLYDFGKVVGIDNHYAGTLYLREYNKHLHDIPVVCSYFIIAYTHARTHACTHARTHAHTHTHIHCATNPKLLLPSLHMPGLAADYTTKQQYPWLSKILNLRSAIEIAHQECRWPLFGM